MTEEELQHCVSCKRRHPTYKEWQNRKDTHDSNLCWDEGGDECRRAYTDTLVNALARIEVLETEVQKYRELKAALATGQHCEHCGACVVPSPSCGVCAGI